MRTDFGERGNKELDSALKLYVGHGGRYSISSWVENSTSIQRE